MNTYANLKDCAWQLGYEFSDEDCEEIMKGSCLGESVWEATTDYLNAYESCKDFGNGRYDGIYDRWKKVMTIGEKA